MAAGPNRDNFDPASKMMLRNSALRQTLALRTRPLQQQIRAAHIENTLYNVCHS
jgi:hypothetical protein